MKNYILIKTNFDDLMYGGWTDIPARSASDVAFHFLMNHCEEDLPELRNVNRKGTYDSVIEAGTAYEEFLGAVRNGLIGVDGSGQFKGYKNVVDISTPHGAALVKGALYWLPLPTEAEGSLDKNQEGSLKFVASAYLTKTGKKFNIGDCPEKIIEIQSYGDFEEATPDIGKALTELYLDKYENLMSSLNSLKSAGFLKDSDITSIGLESTFTPESVSRAYLKGLNHKTFQMILSKLLPIATKNDVTEEEAKLVALELRNGDYIGMIIKLKDAISSFYSTFSRTDRVLANDSVCNIYTLFDSIINLALINQGKFKKPKQKREKRSKEEKMPFDEKINLADSNILNEIVSINDQVGAIKDQLINEPGISDSFKNNVLKTVVTSMSSPNNYSNSDANVTITMIAKKGLNVLRGGMTSGGDLTCTIDETSDPKMFKLKAAAERAIVKSFRNFAKDTGISPKEDGKVKIEINLPSQKGFIFQQTKETE